MIILFMTGSLRIYVKARIAIRRMCRRVLSTRVGTAIREAVEDFRYCVEEYGFRYGVRM